MRLARLQVGDDHAGQAADPLQPHVVAGEEKLGAHVGAGLVGQPVARHAARPGEPSGAVMILKSVAPSALVKM